MTEDEWRIRTAIPEISKYSKALIASYGAGDAALLDVLFGNYKPTGHLPIELPSLMEAVRIQGGHAL